MGADSTRTRAARKRGPIADSGVGRKTNESVKRGAAPPPNAGPLYPQPVWDIRNRLQENFRRVEALFEQIAAEDDARGRLAAVAEMRRHIELAEKTLERTVDRDAQRDFEEAVLAALESVDVMVRQKVIDALHAGDDTSRESPGRRADRAGRRVAGAKPAEQKAKEEAVS